MVDLGVRVVVRAALVLVVEAQLAAVAPGQAVVSRVAACVQVEAECRQGEVCDEAG